MKTKIHEYCRDGFDRALEHNVNDIAAVAVPIAQTLHAHGARRGSALRALVLASLCGLAAIPAPAVTVASNLKVSINGNQVVLSWTGAAGVLYQAQGATSLGGITAWQNIDAPTTSSSVSSIMTSPAEFYRVGVFTNMDPYSTYARTSGSLAPDTAAPTVPTGLTGSAPTSGRVNLSWNASIDQGTVTKVSGKNVTNTSGLKGYNVYRGGAFLAQVLAPATTTSDTSVSPSTTYSYTVKAIDVAGNSSASSSAVNVHTPAAAIANYSLSPANASYSASAASGSVNVSGGSGSWSVSNPNTWITITSGASGTGNGAVNYSVSANTGTSQRSGNMTIAGQTFTVTQAGVSACAYSISPASSSIGSPAASGSVSVNITAGSGCSWSVSNPNSWITITSGASGTGNGTVNYSVAANTSTSQRSGNMTIAGQNFTLTQAAASGGGGSAPVGYWTFDTANVSGTTAMDSSGTGNSGTLQGTVLPTIVAGKTNQAVKLDGVSDLVSVPDSANLNIKGPFTVAAWVNFASVPTSGQFPNVVAKLNSPSSNYGYGLFWNGSGVSGIIGSGSPSWSITSPSPAPAAGVWNHYVAVFDGAYLKLYVNGVVSSQVAAAAPADTAGIPVKMGPHYGNPAAYGYINGTIDDARIYSRVLSDSEITTLAAGSGGGSTYYVIAASSSPSAGGATTGATGSTLSGTVVTLNASANAGYTFVNWTESGNQVSASSSYSFTVTANRSLVANFTQNNYTISTGSSPAAGGSTSGGGTKTGGSLVTVTAAASVGYTFVNWTENGSQVSTSPIYTFTANANRSLVANFTTILPYVITTISSPLIGGTTSGGGTVSSGSSVTVTAAASSGYTFANWTENGNVVSTLANYSFTANASRTLIANFNANSTSAPGQVVWAKSFGGANADYGQGLATDTNGNVYATGWYDNWADFGGGILPAFGTGSILLAKYSPQGAHIWSKGFGIGAGASSNCSGKGLAVATRDGNVVIVGYFHGTIDFSSSAQIPGAALTAVGSYDIFVAKYSATGGYLWAKRFGSGLDCIGNAVAIDSSGNVLITGSFEGTVNFGDASRPSAAGSDIFALKLKASDGSTLWSKQLGSTASTLESGNGIAVDSVDNVVVTGSFIGTANFGGTPLTSSGGNDVFVAKYSPAGAHLWSNHYGGPDQDTGISVAVDSANNVIVSGTFTGSGYFGGQTFTAHGMTDMFVAKYSGSDGSHLWSRYFGGASIDHLGAMGVDSSGNVTLAGGFSQPMTFAGKTIPNVGGLDIYAVKYSANGDEVWGRGFASTGGTYGDGESEEALGCAVDKDGNAIITGNFKLPIAFDNFTITPIGNWDMFLAKLAP